MIFIKKGFMPKITDVFQIEVRKNKIIYKGEEIGRWWGKTLYQLDPSTQTLRYRNFNLIGLMFHHICGYKNKYNNHGLADWLKLHNVAIQPGKNGKTSKKVVIQALKQLQTKVEFKFQCSSGFGVANLSDAEVKKNKLITTQSIIDLFEKNGLDINAFLVDKPTTTVLHEACRNGYYDVVEYLINKGASINTVSSDYTNTALTPLQQAIENSDDELTKLLLLHLADVNVYNTENDLAIHMAIEHSKDPKKIITHLLNYGADINAIGHLGKTPLYKACENVDIELARFFIDNGADVNAHDPLIGSPPIAVAFSKDHKDIFDLLIEKGADRSYLEDI